MVFAGYSGFLHYLQQASHELATIGINVTKNEVQIQIKKPWSTTTLTSRDNWQSYLKLNVMETISPGKTTISPSQLFISPHDLGGIGETWRVFDMHLLELMNWLTTECWRDMNDTV